MQNFEQRHSPINQPDIKDILLTNIFLFDSEIKKLLIELIHNENIRNTQIINYIHKQLSTEDQFRLYLLLDRQHIMKWKSRINPKLLDVNQNYQKCLDEKIINLRYIPECIEHGSLLRDLSIDNLTSLIQSNGHLGIEILNCFQIDSAKAILNRLPSIIVRNFFLTNKNIVTKENLKKIINSSNLKLTPQDQRTRQILKSISPQKQLIIIKTLAHHYEFDEFIQILQNDIPLCLLDKVRIEQRSNLLKNLTIEDMSLVLLNTEEYKLKQAIYEGFSHNHVEQGIEVELNIQRLRYENKLPKCNEQIWTRLNYQIEQNFLCLAEKAKSTILSDIKSALWDLCN
jgi:hypothetical protein